jgi:hypothetical protein
MEIGQAGQVGHRVRALVVWVLLRVQGVARIQLRNLAANLALASLMKLSLVKTLIVVSIFYKSLQPLYVLFQPLDFS